MPSYNILIVIFFFFFRNSIKLFNILKIDKIDKMAANRAWWLFKKFSGSLDRTKNENFSSECQSSPVTMTLFSGHQSTPDSG